MSKKEARERRGVDRVKNRIKNTRKKILTTPDKSPWLARLFCILFGFIDGTIILLLKQGMDETKPRLPNETFNLTSVDNWFQVISNPLMISAVILAVISIIGMTAIFSHDRSHRLFSIIGGVSYITIVAGSSFHLEENVDAWVYIGVGIILLSLSVSNIFHMVFWLKDKVKYLRKGTQ